MEFGPMAECITTRQATNGSGSTQLIAREWYLDSAGVVFAKHLGIPVCIITGEDTAIVKRRAEKLKIDHLFQGVQDKLAVAKDLCNQLNISLADVAYIGDDLNDVQLLKAAGISAAPGNAPDYIKQIAKINIKQIAKINIHTRGGDGAFREFVETIVRNAGRWNEIEKHFL